MQTTGIILGAGAPNQCRDGRKTKCAIVLCDDIGLIRVYPIPADLEFPVWGKVEFNIERNPTDNRHESYKIASGFSISGKIENAHQKREILNACCLKSGADDPIEYQNKAKKSIALVRQEYGTLSATLAQRVPELPEDDPECGWIMTQGAHWSKPYVVWTSAQGKQHTSHLVGSEVYQGLRRNPEYPFRIFENMQLLNPDYERWMLLGNMRDRRNVWCVVHLHRLKKSIGDSMLPCLNLQNGKPEGWPYSQQEEVNVNVVDGQLGLFTTDYTTSHASLGNTLIAS